MLCAISIGKTILIQILPTSNNFHGFSQFEDQLNVSISTNDLMDQCADLFDLDNEELSAEFGKNSDDDITLSELIPPKKKKGEPGRDSSGNMTMNFYSQISLAAR